MPSPPGGVEMTFASSSVKLACACGRVTGYQDGMVVPPGAMSLLQSGMDDKLIWMVVALIVAAGRASLCSLLAHRVWSGGAFEAQQSFPRSFMLLSAVGRSEPSAQTGLARVSGLARECRG